MINNLNDTQKLVFSFDEIESIEDIGYQECIDIEVADDHSFTLSNGLISHNSAKQGLSDGLGRAEVGYFSTRGVPLNAYEVPIQKIAANEELENIIKCLKLKLKEDHQPDLTYEKILLANDADCFEEHSKILTKRGYVELKDIKYGDEVLTHAGNWKPVINIIEKIKNEYVKVELNNDVIFISKNHKFPVYRDGKIQIIKACELRMTDFFLKRK